ncbi:MAG: hypothetical protein J7623_21180 [Chitinophaga sp.]|uniref:hypothetical protein n=1 Tax=Chitinophaga sp. TaxID=1869181 RepID=UPI001B026153|nr:hypothetical protein [Chitinophaga sp.]MBO9731165.1 hypothetical protein [Chitinophaga sp.]
MSFLGNLFKRKPGGTFMGNLLRKTANTVAGAIPFVGGIASKIVGQGAMMISQEEADKRDLSDADYMTKYGQQKDGRPIPVFNPAGQTLLATAAGGAVAGANAAVSGLEAQKAAENAGVWQYLKWLPVAGLALLIYKVYNNKKRHR